VPQTRKTALLLALLAEDDHESVLVFCRTKHKADRIAQALTGAGLPAEALHGDRTQAAREEALSRFKSGAARILVATDIAQRGLDISGITHVINYDVPQQAEDYVHRIGRTGRAATSGDAYTFMAPDEIATVRLIERVIGQSIPRVSRPGFDFGTG
jgi:ATP-dependent RNA helicase RhlE